MLRPVPGFATYPTHHCVTGSLKHIYDQRLGALLAA